MRIQTGIARITRYLKSLPDIPADIRRNRFLVWRLTRLFTERRYRGSVLGVAWALLNPLAMLAVYTVAFSFILGIAWEDEGGAGHVGFALVLFCGLIVFDLFSQTANQAPDLMASNKSFIKKVVFPTQILPLALVLSVAFDSLVRTIILIIAILLVKGSLPASTFWVFPILFPLFLFCLGCACFLAVLGVHFRDLSQIAAIFTQMLFFLTPVLYPLKKAPGLLGTMLMANPLTHLVELFRRALLGGHPPGLIYLTFTTLACLWFCLAGYGFFLKNRQEMADLV